MTNQLNQEQISTAAAYLSAIIPGADFDVDSPLQQMACLLAEIERHPSRGDDLNAPDAHYALLKRHALNSQERAEDALKGLAELLEKLGCAGDGLDEVQVAQLSCLLHMVADNVTTSRELHNGAVRVLAVRKIARLQAEIPTPLSASSMKKAADYLATALTGGNA